MANTESLDSITSVLHGKRKAREPKSCFPCRQRKVKCDNRIPCKRCVDRDHPELCIAQPRSKRVTTIPTHNAQSIAGTVTGNRDISELPTPELIEHLRTSVKTIEETIPAIVIGLRRLEERCTEAVIQQREGVHAIDVDGETVYLGSNSLPAFVQRKSQDSGATTQSSFTISQAILPAFGLNNATLAYPFGSTNPAATDDWSQLLRLLPSNNEIMSYFNTYRFNGHSIFPILTDIGDFESQLYDFLDRRMDYAVVLTDAKPSQMAWVGLLFAVLGSGVQLSDLPSPERVARMRAFVNCAFQVLRMVNFLRRPSLEVVQILLFLGNILQNDMNPSVSWNVLGATIRVSQSLGLHQSSEGHPTSRRGADEDLKRRKIWWLVVWQDSLLSYLFDRPYGTLEMNCAKPIDPKKQFGWTYPECMYMLCEIVHSFKEPAHSSRLTQKPEYYVRKLENIIDKAAEHIRDKSRCRNVQERVEHNGIRINISSVKSGLFRSKLMTGNQGNYLKLYQASLRDACEAFIDMQRLSIIPTRTWSFIHTPLTSALSLAMTIELAPDDETSILLHRFMDMLQIYSAKEDVDKENNSQPFTRCLSALRRILSGTSASSASSVSGLAEPNIGQKVAITAEHDVLARTGTSLLEPNTTVNAPEEVLGMTFPLAEGADAPPVLDWNILYNYDLGSESAASYWNHLLCKWPSRSELCDCSFEVLLK